MVVMLWQQYEYYYYCVSNGLYLSFLQEVNIGIVVGPAISFLESIAIAKAFGE